MNEFETLEQYQNSIKEFNERTRLEFEDFIQKQGSDRNKLQLRCTPFTEKKGGYGSFDLDFGLQIWRHQQSKADELDRIIALRDQQIIEQGQRFNTQSQQIASLKKQLERLGYTDNGGELMKPPIGEPPTFLQYLDQLKKGDHVYVDFTSESATEFSGGQFTGYGVLDRVEDGRVYGRRDDGIPFTCMVSDVTKVQPNPNKSGVRVITPSGESYVCAWDLASKDGEG